MAEVCENRYAVRKLEAEGICTRYKEEHKLVQLLEMVGSLREETKSAVLESSDNNACGGIRVMY